MNKRILLLVCVLVLVGLAGSVSAADFIIDKRNRKERTAEVISLSEVEQSEALLPINNILTNYIFCSNTKYINVSTSVFVAGDAPNEQLEAHLSDKQGSHEHLGSIPSRSASPALLFLNSLGARE